MYTAIRHLDSEGTSNSGKTYLFPYKQDYKIHNNKYKKVHPTSSINETESCSVK